jgi:polar amino acid transport system permease protein
VAELTRQGQLVASSTFKNMTVFTLVALLYLAMSLPLTYLAYRLEKKFGRR